MSKEDNQHNELRDRIDHALAELVHGEGLTPARLQSIAPWLVDELGVRTAQEACDLIRRTLEDLDWSRVYRPTIASRGKLKTDALRNAFGGPGQPKSLTQRREEFSRACGIVRQAMASRENAARELLADTLARIASARK